MSLITDGEAKITKAKTNLILKHVFIAVVALGLRIYNAKERGIRLPFPTMATDGKCVYWDEDFVASITVYELIGVLAHEVIHIMMLHMLRRGNRDPLIWNIACDYIVNIIVLDMGLQLPADRLYNEKYRANGWTVERVYDDIIDQQEKLEKEYKMPPQPGQGEPQEGDGQPGQPTKGEGDKPSQESQPGQGKGNQPGKKTLWGTFMDPLKDDGTPMDAHDKAILEEEIKIKVHQAAAAAAGNLPKAFKGLIKALGTPTIDWHAYIQQWVSGHTPDDYTWRRPNKQMLAMYDMIMPSVQFNGAGVGVLTVDQSGSVDNKAQGKFVTEIIGMIEACNPDKLYILLHDVKVHKTLVWERGDTFESLERAATGGTRIKPVFDYVKDEIEEEVNWMICFTDMEINDFPTEAEAPDYPVLWAATGPKRAKFGTYIALKPALEMAE